MPTAVLITGAGTGFGLATALFLAKRDYRVYASMPDLSQQEAVMAAAAEHRVSLPKFAPQCSRQSRRLGGG